MLDLRLEVVCDGNSGLEREQLRLKTLYFDLQRGELGLLAGWLSRRNNAASLLFICARLGNKSVFAHTRADGGCREEGHALLSARAGQLLLSVLRLLLVHLPHAS